MATGTRPTSTCSGCHRIRRSARLRDQRRAPYRFLDSYDLLDASIYAGREADIDRLEGEVLAHRLVVLQGSVGVGKTSLLQAGLMPRLMTRGYLVLAAQDYADPVAALLSGLNQARDQIQVDLDPASGLVGSCAPRRPASDAPLCLSWNTSRTSSLSLVWPSPPGAFSRRVARFPRNVRSGVQIPRLPGHQHPPASLGQLAYFQPAVPDIYHHVVALDLLLPSQARRAVLAPLEGLQPPMVFDPAVPGRTAAADWHRTGGRGD